MIRITLCLLVALSCAPALAQTAGAATAKAGAPPAKLLDGQLRLPEFAALEKKASESVSFTFDANMLRLASGWLNPNNPDQAKAKKLVTSLQGVYVRSFTFDTDFAYPKADIDGLRRQLTAPGWSPMVNVKSRKSNTDLDVFMLVNEGQAHGLAIIASEPRQFTIVNIVGTIKLEDLHDLQGNFGVPDLDIETPDKKPAPKKK